MGELISKSPFLHINHHIILLKFIQWTHKKAPALPCGIQSFPKFKTKTKWKLTILVTVNYLLLVFLQTFLKPTSALTLVLCSLWGRPSSLYLARFYRFF